jgi:hypothetical protein
MFRHRQLVEEVGKGAFGEPVEVRVVGELGGPCALEDPRPGGEVGPEIGCRGDEPARLQRRVQQLDGRRPIQGGRSVDGEGDRPIGKRGDQGAPPRGDYSAKCWVTKVWLVGPG